VTQVSLEPQLEPLSTLVSAASSPHGGREAVLYRKAQGVPAEKAKAPSSPTLQRRMLRFSDLPKRKATNRLFFSPFSTGI
jgi:hypothetical protein